MKSKFILCLTLIFAATTAYALPPIQSITSNNATTAFNHASGLFTMNGSGGLVQYDSSNSILTGTFTLSMTLQDVAAGSIATATQKSGTTGTFSFKNGGTTYLAGNIASFDIVEVFNNGGMLAGSGSFNGITGTLQPQFGAGLIGNIVNISFYVPTAINNFNSIDFGTAATNFTVTSVPEPATMGLLCLGALSIFKRRNIK